MTAPLKVVTIECIEHEVTCLNERVFIKTMNHLLTNCSQSTLLAMICRLSLLVLIQAKQCVKDYVMQSNESLGVLRLIFLSSRAGRRPVIGWKHLGGPWPLSDFYRELSSGCITDWKGSDTTWELRMHSVCLQVCLLSLDKWGHYVQRKINGVLFRASVQTWG